ncbi:hypothetical protein [Kitasatospora sp. A2-31]|uniref:hypothetical protein n=1 Tax=Kitasatospora sp. A2-31 TaxID=2916414 RepID=UPI001EEEA06E|nr:hypothetical protein [Kitasatospora sp. A2-31]MCG6500534.1 hypothetical protein [Kitasatospora sp. A2-31]
MTPAPSPPAFGRTPLTSTIPTLLLVSAGDEQYRRYALEQIAARHRVVLLSPSEPTWETPYIHGHEVADTSDPDASLAAAERLAADHHIKGVLTWDEFAQHTAAPPRPVRHVRDPHRPRPPLPRQGGQPCRVRRLQRPLRRQRPRRHP